jgi:1,4-dihydroxy-2-naphthoyl-CoA hydrolase
MEFPPDLDPSLIERLIETEGGQLAKKMGITLRSWAPTNQSPRCPWKATVRLLACSTVAPTWSWRSRWARSLRRFMRPRSYRCGNRNQRVTLSICPGGSRPGSVPGGLPGAHALHPRNRHSDEEGRRLSTVRMTNYLMELRETNLGCSAAFSRRLRQAGRQQSGRLRAS